MIKKIPNTYVIVFSILIFIILLTWIIPSGEFNRVQVDGRSLIEEQSYHEVEASPQGFGAFFLAPVRGFIRAAQIIAFVLIVGASFSIFTKTGAINSGLEMLIQWSLKKRVYKRLMIPLLMIFFSLAGATFGMCEEVLVFILITIPFALALGYDSIVGLAIPFVGAGAGFAGAFSNPFTLGIAQGIAELPPMSGWAYRMVVWSVMTAIAIIFVLRYALKIEKNKENSPVYDIDQKRTILNTTKNEQKVLTLPHALSILVFVGGLGVLIYGVTNLHWYINEIAGLFFAMGLLAAFINKLKMNDAVDAFIYGAKDMVNAALLIGICQGMLIVAEDGKIIDTILFYTADITKGIHKGFSVQVMFLVQTMLNFFIPSGSGQAALTMPVMAPLSDLLGITRQTAVLAYQLGDGLSNMIIPTSGVTMGILAAAEIPYEKWFKWLLPLFVIFVIVAMVLLALPVIFFNWGPF